MTDSYFVKVESPDFKLPQVVIDNLPDFATPQEVGDAIAAYIAGLPQPIQASDLSYTHVQSTPSAIWEFTHTLPFIPNVTITDTAGTVLTTEITYPAPNTVRSTAAGAFSGIARLS